MSKIKDGGPGEIPVVPVRVPADEWDNTIRKFGVVSACEWFGHAPDSEFTAETIKELRARSEASIAKALGEPQ
jgi:hypothetical protein